ncbi:hypothetical protein IB236_08710 [Acidovorax sp. ACV02]|uniref:hypothetical protein n=1 Tax=Acidovorax sp. ACV02 TaxID=2769310 RepID=UPI00177D73D1|nr:hypothetical protein [Acidovorax sp. ACV02]MBD9405412.1 hypothetical protein [Acidovorax sp. ACV02]
MAAVENSVVHLKMRFGATELAIGTGFLYERNDKLFIITAWHNVTGRHSETLVCQSGAAAVPDNLVVTLRLSVKTKNGQSGLTPCTLIVPLADSAKALFYVHPQRWPRVDVVAIPFDPDSLDFEGFVGTERFKQPFRSVFPGQGASFASFEVCPFQQFALQDLNLEKQWLETVDVTEELFIPGYPQNIQTHLSQPVWKRATIASSIQQGLDRQPKFLIDSASHKGMSGSPVVFYSPRGNLRIGGKTTFFGRQIAILAGVYVGRVGVAKDIDPQIGTVWHRSVIDEIIDGQCFERLPEEIEATSAERDAAVRKVLSACSKEGVANVNNPDLPSRYYVQQDVMEELQGRAMPDKVLATIQVMAQSYDGPFAPEEND